MGMINNILRKFTTGEPLIVIDDSRVNGNAAMICLAELAEPESINLMIKHARGIVSVGMTQDMALRAGLTNQNAAVLDLYPNSRQYTISMDADETTTGISAFERSFSIKKLASTCSSLGFKKPGHIFPVVCHKDRLFEHVSVLEAAVDLAIISGKSDMVVICDILDLHGNMADGLYAYNLANHLGIPCVYISEILEYRLIHEGLLNLPKTVSMQVEGKSIDLISYSIHDQIFNVAIHLEVKEKMLQTIDEAYCKLQECYPQFDTYKLNKIYEADSSWLDSLKRMVDGQCGLILFDTGKRKIPPLMINMIFQIFLLKVKSELYSLEDQLGSIGID
jgi:3,4-dihydroxy-2-butanone 4-phosphate synthase